MVPYLWCPFSKLETNTILGHGLPLLTLVGIGEAGETPLCVVLTAELRVSGCQV